LGAIKLFPSLDKNFRILILTKTGKNLLDKVKQCSKTYITFSIDEINPDIKSAKSILTTDPYDYA